MGRGSLGLTPINLCCARDVQESMDFMSPLPRDPQEFESMPWLHPIRRDFQGAEAVPTMLSPKEQSFYYWLTETWTTGAGAIVDLGCFVGGSTARLAAGRHAATTDAARTAPIYAYDRFTVAERNKKQLYKHGIAPFDGQDMFPLAQELLSPWNENLHFRHGMIQDIGWQGDPIEVLTLDAMKNYNNTDKIAQDFFPSLLPGQSVVVHQDFLHWSQPFLAPQMSLLRDYFTPVAFVPDDTVVYLCTRAITPEIMAAATVADLSVAALETHLQDTKMLLAGFNVEDRIDTLIDTLHRNPKTRIAWKMKPAPK